MTAGVCHSEMDGATCGGVLQGLTLAYWLEFYLFF